MWCTIEPLPPVEQSTQTPVEVNKIFVAPDIDNFMQNYDMLKLLPVTQADEARLFLDNVLPTDMPHLEQKLGCHGHLAQKSY